MDDYSRVEAALRRIERDATDQPGLDELAADAGLSPGHFQRVFTRWAGVSPKRFLQAVTAESTRERLRDAQPVLDVALESGLSGPGRLHDLTLRTEAMTPGQVGRHGEGVTIHWGTVPSPFGPAFVAATPHGICALAFDVDGDPASVLGAYWSGAALRPAPRSTLETWRAHLVDPLRAADGPLALHVRGTNFQIQVWRALLCISAGAVADYGTIARGIGRPRASRAVGGAIGSNPVALLVPCHRVLRRGGGWGGYRWGTTRKLAILGRELATTDQPRGRPA